MKQFMEKGNGKVQIKTVNKKILSRFLVTHFWKRINTFLR